MDHTFYRIKDQRPQYYPTCQTDAEGRDYEQLWIWRNRRRKWTGFCLFSCNLLHLYALRTGKSEFYEVLRYINQCLIKWVRRSYKKKNTRSRAEHWLGAVARRDRNLFAHWKFGILPSVGEGAVWVERLTYGSDGDSRGGSLGLPTSWWHSNTNQMQNGFMNT